MIIPSDLPSALRIAAAIAEARELIDALGEDHPDAMRAINRAVELADPGFMDRALLESGITLPEPSHCDGEGNPLISSADLAVSLGVPHEQLRQTIESIGITQSEILHRIQ